MRGLSRPLPCSTENLEVREKVLRELVSYCKYYNLPLEHIVTTMEALKVAPMIRGIGFEFTVYDKLRNLLPETKWKLEKRKDIDILVTHQGSGDKIRVECKLAKKDSFRISKDNQVRVSVKCMRSRTRGDKAAKPLAKKYNVKVSDVRRHRDQYRDVDFDFVVTSIGNALWRTTEEGVYEFMPKPVEIDFLRKFFDDPTLDTDGLKERTFNYMLIARSSHLKVSPQNSIECVSKGCMKAGTSKSCGFIPHYPIVNLNDYSVWKPIEKAEELFEDFVRKQR